MHTGYLPIKKMVLSAIATLAIVALLLFTLSLTINGFGFGETVFGYGYGYSSGGGISTSSSDTEDTSDEDTATAIETVSQDLNGKIDADGNMTETVAVASSDGNAMAEVPAGTQALDANGDALAQITYQQVTPASIPSGNNVMASADFGPDGATFDPPITVTINYDPNSLPEGVTGQDLILAYYDDVTGEWVELNDIVVDTENHTVSGLASHFTQFAVIVSLEEVVPAAIPAVTPAETPTADPVVEPTPAVTTTESDPVVEPSQPQKTTQVENDFKPLSSKTQEKTESSSSGIPWIIIVPIIAVLAIGLLTFYMRNRQKATRV